MAQFGRTNHDISLFELSEARLVTLSTERWQRGSV
jgi:hypothetical protein